MENKNFFASPKITISNFKIEGIKKASDQYNNSYNNIINKIINDCNKLDFQANLKLIDSLDIKELEQEVSRANDHNLKSLYLCILSIQIKSFSNNRKYEFLSNYLKSDSKSPNQEIILTYKQKLIHKNPEYIQKDNTVIDYKLLLESINSNLEIGIDKLEYISLFFNNPLCLIHFNEMVIFVMKETIDSNLITNIKILKNVLSILVKYFFWKQNSNNKNDIKIDFERILVYQIKFFCIFTLEELIELLKSSNYNRGELSQEILDIQSILYSIVFNLNFESNDIYLISLMTILIIDHKIIRSENFPYENLSQIKDSIINNKLTIESNKNSIFIQNLFKDSNLNLELVDGNKLTLDIIILLKLVEFNLFCKYNKGIEKTYSKKTNLNLSDFLTIGLYNFEVSYDYFEKSIKSFRKKITWNFCEIMKTAFEPFPKLVKKTLIRHLVFVPNDDSLLFNLVQYYYLNKNYVKCKLLIIKSLSKNNPQLQTSEINSILLMMLINIELNEEKFGECLENAILNIENTKLLTNNEINTKSYYILGICYSKIGDNMTNYDEKIENYELALSSFKLAHEKNSNNPAYIYYKSRQYLELKRLDDALNTINKIDLKNLDTKNLNIFGTLKSLILVGLHQYDKAAEILDPIVLNNNYSLRVNYAVILFLYVMIYRSISMKSGTNYDTIIGLITNSVNGIFSEIEKDHNFLSQNILSSPENSRKNETFKKLISYSKFNKDYNESTKESIYKKPKGGFIIEKKNLEQKRIEIIKNFFNLYDIMNENNFENKQSVLSALNDYLGKVLLQSDNEDKNILFCKALSAEYELKFDEAENFLKKKLEINPSSILALKKLSRLYLKRGDLGNAYIYINKAIKIDSTEPDLWNYLGSYYLSNNDSAKYYECIMKEISNSKIHLNSFLLTLIPKTII